MTISATGAQRMLLDPLYFLISILLSAPFALWSLAVERPLRLLYVHGFPWQGRSAVDVCAQLTTIEAQWWGDDRYPDRITTCEDLIRRRFDSFLISTAVLCYIGLAATGIACLLIRWCIVRPLANEIVYFVKKLKC